MNLSELAIAVSLINFVILVLTIKLVLKSYKTHSTWITDAHERISFLATRITKLGTPQFPTQDKPVAKVRAGVQKPAKKGIKNV